MEPDSDVVVVGGGAAGLSAALTLARARRRVVVVDAGEQRNLRAAEVHGYLTRDGISPSELVELGRREVRRYGGRVVDGHAIDARVNEGGFVIALKDGRELRGRRVLLATGLVDELPDVAGLAPRWGRDVLHCPYCHGWEIRDRSIGVLATGELAVHQALLFRQWTPAVTLLSHIQPPPSDEDLLRLEARGVIIVKGVVASLEVVGDALRAVVLEDGTRVPLQALTVQTRPHAATPLLASLGLTTVDHPRGVGELVPASATGRTDMAGVWVAGNANDILGQVAHAVAAGVVAAADINADLIEADTAAAVDAYLSAAVRA